MRQSVADGGACGAGYDKPPSQLPIVFMTDIGQLVLLPAAGDGFD